MNNTTTNGAGIIAGGQHSEKQLIISAGVVMSCILIGILFLTACIINAA